LLFSFSYENDELKPYVEPEADMSDPKRIEALVCLGFNRYDVENSLDSQKYDDAYATYLLLGRKSTDVRSIRGKNLNLPIPCFSYSLKVTAAEAEVVYLLGICLVNHQWALHNPQHRVLHIAVFIVQYRQRMPSLIEGPQAEVSFFY
jgi:hypothetical protein